MADGESVRVAVRVRPFNQREKDRDSKLCVPQQLSSIQKTARTRASHLTSAIGRMMGIEFVFLPELGVTPSRERARPDGYNECGGEGMTGAGKSYSMVGYGVNKGVSSCRLLCRRFVNCTLERNCANIL
eukprot:759846-Hanusia_phi.AAC.1